MKISELQQQGVEIKAVAPLTISGLKAKTPAFPVAPKELTFGERIKKELAERRETFTAGVEAESRGQQTTAETILQGVGQGVGFAYDVAGQTIGAGIRALPEMVKKPFKMAGKAILETPLGQSGLKALSQGIESYQEWAKINPRTARNLESSVNIAMLLAYTKTGEAVTKKGISVTGKVAGKGATEIEKGLVKQNFDEALDIIKPVLSKSEKQQALEAGRGVATQKILPRRYEKIILKPTTKELEIAETVKNVVSKSKNPVDNITVLREKIAVLAKEVDIGLEGNNAIFNKNQILSALNKAKESSRVVFGSDKQLQNSYNTVIDEMMRQIGKQSKSLDGLNKARRAFDQIIKQKFPNLFNSPLGDNVRQNAVLDVRRAVSQYIEKQLPEGNQFKQLLHQQNLMFDAVTNISQKVSSVVDLSVVQKTMRALRQNPLVAGVTGGILTYGALMGMFSNPVVIGTLVLGGTYKLGKTIITSKILRESLVSILRALEKAGKFVDANTIRETIKQLPKEAGMILPKIIK